MSTLTITVAYLVDFRIGLLVSTPLSVLHVYLELPLDFRTMGSLLPG